MSKLNFPGRSLDFVEYTTCRNWIGGEWKDAASGETIPVENPWHGKAMGQVVMSGAADVDAAVKVAAEAYKTWREVPLKERVQVFFKLKELCHRDAEELAWLVTHENGKDYAQAMGSVLKGIECIEMGTALQQTAAGEQLDVSRGINCSVNYEPLGVCAGVAPFNFPFMVPFWMLPQALCAGNTFVLKPSEQVPYCAMRIAELLQEAGLPDGVFNIVNGGRETVEAITDHPEIKAFGFVGSTKVAKIVYARSAQLGKRTLCLGGAKNHLVMVPDADYELTTQTVVASAYGCAGQRCMAASLLVAVGDSQKLIDGIVEEARKIKLGKDMGAIINKASVERITNYINDAEKRGAKVLLDGRNASVAGFDGYWIGPTILDNVSPDMPAGCEEIFGPVLSIVRAKTLDEAIEIENASPYGNAAAIFTTNGGVARYAIDRFNAGMCGVNVGVPVPREPFGFGGWNDSKLGHGDLTGMDGFRFWTRPRKVTTKWAMHSDQTWMS